MKGGVGKTTIAALLCRHGANPLALQGLAGSGAARLLRRFGRETRNVLAVDLDPQANLSQALMGEQSYRQFLSDGSPSIVEVFNGYKPPTATNASAGPLDFNEVVHRTTDPNLEIIPSRFDFSDNLISAVRPDERVLARLIANHFQDKDLIIIDCAPTESILTRAAYHASRYILVPVKPEYFATIGFPLLKDSLDDFRSNNKGHQIDVLGVVVNNSFYHGGNDGGPEKERAMNEIREEAGENDWGVFDNELPHSRGYPKMMRGDYTWLGNAPTGFRPIADEFFRELP